VSLTSRAAGTTLAAGARAWLRRAVRPDGPSVWPTGEALQSVWIARAIAVLVSLGVDVAIVLWMRDTPGVSQAPLGVFAFTNLGAIGVDAVVTLTVLRKEGRWQKPLTYLCTTLEIVAVTAFIQMTGTVTTYFLAAYVLLIFIYRLVFDFALGAWVTANAIVAYLAVTWLEHLGLFSYASLFEAGDSLIPPVPTYRIIVAVSVGSGAVIAWMMANVASAVARANQARIARLEADLVRARLRAIAGRLSGARAGDYRLEEVLGRGGMGEVYVGRGRDGREVAVKVLHPHLGADETHRERFRREAAVAANMPSGTVARVLGTGVTDEGAEYIVMERLHGEDLGARLRRVGRLSPDEVLLVADQLAVALDAAHALGIVHRDLKPTNVFLTTGGDGRTSIRLLDFGVAHLSDIALGATLTGTSAIMGSPGYMAPEVIARGANAATAAADVFGCTAVIYAALTGRPAFPARHTAGEILESLQVQPASCRDAIQVGHEEVDLVLAAGMAKTPGQRYARVSELVAELRQALAGTLPPEARARTLAARSAENDQTLTSIG
jgi:predicted Ser/Thr protein kinase